MKKINVSRKIFKALVGTTLCLFASSSFAEDVKPGMASGTTKRPAADECSREALLAYFPEMFVKETLAKFGVPQDKWDAIVKDLNEKDKGILKTVETKAAAMNPNPLKDPNHRMEAVKIFKETLFEVFSGVLSANGITDKDKIQAMLDDVQQRKAKSFAVCLKKASDEDDDGEDDDDDDDDDDQAEENKNVQRVKSSDVQKEPALKVQMTPVMVPGSQN